MCICYKREWNAHADRMLNLNLQKFGEAKAILLFSCRIFRRNTVFFSIRCIRLSMVAITDNKLILVPFFSYFSLSLVPISLSPSLPPSQHSSLPVARHSKRKMQPNAVSRSSLFRVSLPKDIPEDQPLSPASTVSTDSFSSLGK